MDEELVNFTIIFNDSATEDKIREFFQEYVSANAVVINDIYEGEIINNDTSEHVADVWVVKLTSNEYNYNWFCEELGDYVTIRRDE